MSQTLLIGSLGLSLAGYSPPGSFDCPQSILSACATRAQELERFMVAGVTIRGRIDDRGEALLSELWTKPITAREQCGRLLLEVLRALPERECLDLRVWASPEEIVTRRVRRPDLDSTRHLLEARRLPDQLMRPPADREQLHIGALGSVVIQDGHVVIHHSERAREPLLLSIDMTLADWRPMADPNLLVAGQRLLVERDAGDPSAVGIRIAGPVVQDLGEASTVYRFSVEGGAIRPRSISGGLPSGELLKVDYLLVEGQSASLPVAVLDRRRPAVGEPWTVEVSLLDEVAFGSAARPPELRLPALRMEIREIAGSADLIAEFVQPEWLAGASPEERLALAVATILSHWGSEDQTYDLNGDGTIDKHDLLKAVEELR